MSPVAALRGFSVPRKGRKISGSMPGCGMRNRPKLAEKARCNILLKVSNNKAKGATAPQLRKIRKEITKKFEYTSYLLFMRRFNRKIQDTILKHDSFNEKELEE